MAARIIALTNRRLGPDGRDYDSIVVKKCLAGKRLQAAMIDIPIIGTDFWFELRTTEWAKSARSSK